MTQTHEHHEEPNRAVEHALVSRSQRGDREAFNQLVLLHQAGAYALALRMTGDREAAADITQDAFLSAFRAIASFKGSSFRAWLFRIVSNGCFDYWRAQSRRPATSLEAALGGADDGGPTGQPADARLAQLLADPSWGPEELALRGELVAQIEAALLQLPAEQRLAVILSDIHGVPYEEIARIMSSSLGTVKSRISRGRAHLRAVLTRMPELFPRLRRQDGERTFE
jgi:RNA polymerase sigma-70 factor (ECF subfamily)